MCPTFVASLISLTGHVKMVRTELSERSRARIPHTTPERCRLMKDTQKKQRLGQSLTKRRWAMLKTRPNSFYMLEIDTAHRNAVRSNSIVSKVSTQHVREVGEIGENALRCLVVLMLWIAG